MGNRSIKTTIKIDEDVWKKFSILVIEERGCRKKNEVIEQLIKEYIERRAEMLRPIGGKLMERGK